MHRDRVPGRVDRLGVSWMKGVGLGESAATVYLISQSPREPHDFLRLPPSPSIAAICLVWLYLDVVFIDLH